MSSYARQNPDAPDLAETIANIYDDRGEDIE